MAGGGQEAPHCIAYFDSAATALFLHGYDFPTLGTHSPLTFSAAIEGVNSHETALG